MSLTTELTDLISYDEPLDWRWKRAERLVSNAGRVPNNVDKYVKGAVQFLRDYKTKKMEPDCLEDLKAAHPKIYRAFTWYTSASDRCRIESLLLCQNIDETFVAKEMGSNIGHIEWYMALFFDIAEHRNDVPYLWRALHRRNPMLRDNSYGSIFTLWPTMALQHGYDVLKMYINPLDGTPTENAKLDSIINSETRLNAVAAAKNRPINSYSAGEIMSAYSDLRDSEIKREQNATLSRAITPINDMWAQMTSAINVEVINVDGDEPKVTLDVIVDNKQEPAKIGTADANV